ncbi:MAG: hypothetical protein ACI835_000147, partial [Planctomycetota bacterium]
MGWDLRWRSGSGSKQKWLAFALPASILNPS